MTSLLHPIVARAAAGELPAWAVAGDERRAHMARVADLLETWARGLALGDDEIARWRAVGYLHDALRDADPPALTDRLPPALRDLPPDVMHGPAAAERLRIDGVDDGELLLAVGFHTLGHPDFGSLGRAAYAADFLEPARRALRERCEAWRSRMPAQLDGVVLEIVAARIGHLIERRVQLRPESVGFWNALTRGA